MYHKFTKTMNKNSLLRCFAGVFALSLVFVSCQEKGLEETTLEVSPREDIMLNADGNKDVVLEVVTNTEKWNVEKTEWITARQDGNKLFVNAQANLDESERPGRITISAGNAEPVKINVLQAAAAKNEIVLSLTPSDPISFNAKDNTSVELTVTTNAPDWDYTYPEEWLTVSRETNKLIVNAINNTEGKSHAGRVTVKAGDKEAFVNVTQKAFAEETDPTDKILGSISTADTLSDRFAYGATEAVKKTLVFELEEASASETKIRIAYDGLYVDEYNFMAGMDFPVYPEAGLSVARDGIITIPAGQTSGSIEIGIVPVPDTKSGRYLLPVAAESMSEGVAVKNAASHVNFIVRQDDKKAVKNIVYVETNDSDPLDVLDYILEDGTPFFDVVVLFSGNIRYDGQTGKPYMHFNESITKLLENNQTKIQPLRRRGLKVLMGILGDHQAAGLANMTEKGAELFAEEVADMCLEYELDGICVDDEYSYYNANVVNEYLTGKETSLEQATYFLERADYHLKKVVPWETTITMFVWGVYNTYLPSINNRKPASFVDIVNMSYSAGSDFSIINPLDGGDLSMCSFKSVECNLGRGEVTEESARRAKEEGYGWCMWFAFNNARNEWSSLSAAAKGLYNQEVKNVPYQE